MNKYGFPFSKAKLDRTVGGKKRAKQRERKISKVIKKLSDKAGLFQTGFIYDYAFVMLLGLSLLLTYLILN